MLTSSYTVASSGPGVSSAQGHPSASLGGYAATNAWAGGVQFDLFGLASAVDVAANRPDYRCLFVYNDTGSTLTAVRAYLGAGTAGGAVALGVDSRPVNSATALAPQTTEVGSGYTAPSGVAFSAPSTYGAGVVLGDLPPGFGRGVWVRRTPTTSPDAAAESRDVTLEHSGGVAWTRSVLWQTEPAAAATAPPAPLISPPFVPTPTPFTRVSVDFVTTGGSRILWEFDPVFQDAGPYVFQLQMSQSGVPAAADWTDVGPPVREPAYLLDPTARLWGMSTTTHYRLVLTTAAGTYTSKPASAFNGVLHKRDWLNVQEIVRKERLNQEEFVGVYGFLLKAKRYGTRCSCKNPTTGERGNSACPTCYGVGIVGGYHPPIPMTFATLDGEGAVEHVQYNENLGTTRPVTLTGRVLADIPIVHQDAWVSGSGDDLRYYAWTVTEAASVQGMPLVYSCELRQAPRSDVLFRVPIVRPDNYVPSWRAEQTLVM